MIAACRSRLRLALQRALPFAFITNGADIAGRIITPRQPEFDACLPFHGPRSEGTGEAHDEHARANMPESRFRRALNALLSTKAWAMLISSRHHALAASAILLRFGGQRPGIDSALK